MRMRLLPKSEIDKRKADLRQREIDEGLKLTRRVDSLRELHAEEEQKLEKFRVQTVKAIQNEITAQEAIRETLNREIAVLAKQREELLIPIDIKWKELDSKEISLVKRESAVLQRENSVKHREKDIAITERRLYSMEKNTQDLENQAQSKLNDAIMKATEAGEMMEEARIAKRQSDIYKNDALATITEEHRKLDLRTTALEIKEKEYLEKAEELRVAKIQLQDREQTLARAFKRKIK